MATLTAMRALVWAGLVGLVLKVIAPHRVVDLDVFHEMALAREAFARGALPMQDPFAYTPTVPLAVHHEWGTGVVFYALWEGLGLGPLGLALLRFALVGAILAVVYRTARRRGATRSSIVATASFTVLLFARGLSPVRAQLFTYLFVAVLLLLLDRERDGDRRWLVPWLAATMLWVNLHGGFVVGVAMVGAAALERCAADWRVHGPGPAARGALPLALTGAGMAALAFVNPYGKGYVRYLARALAMPRPLVAEWAPLWDPRVELDLVLVFVASLAVLAYAVARTERLRTRGLALVVPFALAAALSQRHLPLYALAWSAVATPALARTPLGHLVEDVWTRRRAAFAAALAALAGFGLWTFVSQRGWDLQVPNDTRLGPLSYPVGATEWLARRGFQGRVLTSFEDGGYVIWRLFPAVKVSLDSRYEAAYQDGVLEAHRAFFEAKPGWEAFLERYPPDAVLVPCAYPVVRRLDARSGWARAYDDGSFCVHLRSAAPVRAAGVGP